jgi:hypothetical protein
MTRNVIRRGVSLALAGFAGLGLALGVPPPAGAFFGYFGAFVPQEGSPAVGNHTMPPFPTMPPPPPQNPTPQTIISPGTTPHGDPAASAPEPATLLTGALGMGLAGFAAWRRRRKARRGQGAAARR